MSRGVQRGVSHLWSLLRLGVDDVELIVVVVETKGGAGVGGVAIVVLVVAT